VFDFYQYILLARKLHIIVILNKIKKGGEDMSGRCKGKLLKKISADSRKITEAADKESAIIAEKIDNMLRSINKEEIVESIQATQKRVKSKLIKACFLMTRE
jgi:translation elongation factor EF-4